MKCYYKQKRQYKSSVGKKFSSGKIRLIIMNYIYQYSSLFSLLYEVDHFTHRLVQVGKKQNIQILNYHNVTDKKTRNNIQQQNYLQLVLYFIINTVLSIFLYYFYIINILIMNLTENQKKFIIKEASLQAEDSVKQQFELIHKQAQISNPDSFLAQYVIYLRDRNKLIQKINELDVQIQLKQNEINLKGDRQQKQEAYNRGKSILNQERISELIKLNDQKIQLQKLIIKMSSDFNFHIKIQGIVKPSPVFQSKSESRTFQSILKAIFKLFQEIMIDGLSKEDLKIFFYFENKWHLLTETENFYQFSTTQSDYLKLQIDRFQSDNKQNLHKECDPTLSKYGKALSIFSLRKFFELEVEKAEAKAQEKVQTAKNSDMQEKEYRKEIILYTDVESTLKLDIKEKIETAGQEFIKQLQEQQNQLLQQQSNKLKSRDIKPKLLQRDINIKQDQFNKLLLQLQEQKQQNNNSLNQKQIEDLESQYTQILNIQKELQGLRQKFIDQSYQIVEQMANQVASGINQTENKEINQLENQNPNSKNKYLSNTPQNQLQNLQINSQRQYKTFQIQKSLIEQIFKRQNKNDSLKYIKCDNISNGYSFTLEEKSQIISLKTRYLKQISMGQEQYLAKLILYQSIIASYILSRVCQWIKAINHQKYY
ncbi:hypothetical protein pb186bvf_011107 [Paramecium bursaria]